ncbi:U3 small nucleolar RNA-associated protein 18 [Nymphon striatum]|nr:U3 small nucleolar RNA-associated protein 18 [Nymphon striatum]
MSKVASKRTSSRGKKKTFENSELGKESAEIFETLGKETDDLLEKQLEIAVFGTDHDVLQHLEETYKSEDSEESDSEEERPQKILKPAWHDEDDEEIKKSHDTELNTKLSQGEKRINYVRTKFTQVMGQQPTWAKLKHARKTEKNASDDQDSDDEITGRAGNFLGKSEKLLRNTLNYRKCSDLNKECRDVSIIKHVEFHPSAQVAAIAGISGNVSLFQVDGKSNPKIQTVNFENFPIEKAHFSKDGEEIIVGGSKKSFFFCYDMIKGKINKVHLDKGMELHSMNNFEMSPDGKFIAVGAKYGHVHIITSKTKEWISSVKLNSRATAIGFDSSNRMYTHSSEGEVYIWDSRNLSNCYHKFYDDGCIYGTALSLSPNNQYLACGSGIVNIYDTSMLMSSTTPKPKKILYNLTTEVNDLKFNCTSEMLAMCSSWKDNAIRLVHFPSMTVYENFPNIDRLRRPQKVDISLNSGYLTIANNTGRAYLFRLNHYNNY